MALRGLGRIRWLPLLLLAGLPWPALRAAQAEDGPKLFLEGEQVHLEAGLQAGPGGTLWIERDDLAKALSVVIRRLIPRPIAIKRRQLRHQRRSWVLCGNARCGTYRGEAGGTEAAPSFDVLSAARVLGYRARRKDGNVHLRQAPAVDRGAGFKRVRVGQLVPDLALPCLDGTTRRIGSFRGKRLLLLTWAPWSPTRSMLERWHALAAERKRRDLRVWPVAVSLEPRRHAQDYTPLGYELPIGLDRNADLGRLFQLDDVGRWFLIDELGVLRAEGARLEEEDLIWIDEHLREPLAKARPLPAPRPPSSTLDFLKAGVKAEPESVSARLALIEALAGEHAKEAIEHAEALVRLKPYSMPFAHRLARIHIDAGNPSEALDVLEKARRRMPWAWVLRKQYWALGEPGRFYSGEIDLAWQKRKRKEEHWLDVRGRRRPTK